MNCEEVRNLIELYVLGELSEKEHLKIEAHLLDCSECSAVDAEYRQIVNEIRQSTGTQLTEDKLERNILLSVENELKTIVTHTPARRKVNFGWITIAAVACLFVGLILRQLWIHLDADMTSDSVQISAAVQTKIPSYSISAGAKAVPTSPADNIVVQGRYIYLLLDDDLQVNVAAIDALTGRVKWRSDVASYGHMTSDEVRLFCLAPAETGGVDLVGVDRADGSVIWRYPGRMADALRGMCTPTVLPGQRICWTTSTTIHVLRSTNGEVLWMRTIPGENLLSAATMIGDNLYVAGINGLYCLSVSSGEQRWQSKYDFKVSRWVRPLIAACNERICVGLRLPNGRSRLFCMDLTDKSAIWIKTVQRLSYLCIVGNRLYLRGQGVQALDMTSGESLWSFASTGCSPLTYAEGKIWFVDTTDKGHLVALYERTGRKTLDLTGIRSCNAFIELDGKGYVKTHDGVIHVLLLKS